ncbi:MAG: DUF6504 family protein [Anaerolineae bacterium]|jgi:hypothetical protein
MDRETTRWQFISEEIWPDPQAIIVGRMSLGEPGIPSRFEWRGVTYTVAEVLRSWKTTNQEGGRPTGGVYVRRHWLDVRTTTGERMVIYCDRQKRPGRSRWWLFRIGDEPLG